MTRASARVSNVRTVSCSGWGKQSMDQLFSIVHRSLHRYNERLTAQEAKGRIWSGRGPGTVAVYAGVSVLCIGCCCGGCCERWCVRNIAERKALRHRRRIGSVKPNA